MPSWAPESRELQFLGPLHLAEWPSTLVGPVGSRAALVAGLVGVRSCAALVGIAPWALIASCAALVGPYCTRTGHGYNLCGSNL
jgi:hypothetical protein